MKAFYVLFATFLIQSSLQVENNLRTELGARDGPELVTPILLRNGFSPQSGQAFVSPQILEKTVLQSPPSGLGINSGCGCQSLVPNTCLPCNNNPSPQVFAAVMNMLECQCATKPKCSPCPALYTAVHEMALRQAYADINNQAHLQEKSIDQAKFYQVAQKAAEDMKREEERAFEAARVMEDATGKAEMYRQKMMAAAMHARQIAAQTLAIGGSMPHIISVQAPNPHIHLGARGGHPHVVKTEIRDQDYSSLTRG